MRLLAPPVAKQDGVVGSSLREVPSALRGIVAKSAARLYSGNFRAFAGMVQCDENYNDNKS
jgi:hypothetical protein